MKAWLAYAGVGLVITLAGVLVALLIVDEASAGAVWFSAGLAFVLQLASFAALLAVRGRPELFLAGWAAGLVVRFAAVGGVAYWLARDEVFPREPALLSLVAFIFVLLLLEPLFLRRGLQAR